jgi:hypothetical protein
MSRSVGIAGAGAASLAHAQLVRLLSAAFVAARPFLRG